MVSYFMKTDKVKNKLLRQNNFFYSSFRAGPLIFKGQATFKQTSKINSPVIILIPLYYKLLFLRQFINCLCNKYFMQPVVNIS